MVSSGALHKGARGSLLVGGRGSSNALLVGSWGSSNVLRAGGKGSCGLLVGSSRTRFSGRAAARSSLPFIWT